MLDQAAEEPGSGQTSRRDAEAAADPPLKAWPSRAQPHRAPRAWWMPIPVLRTIASAMPLRARRALRGVFNVVWWSMTLQLRSKLRERQALYEFFDSAWYLNVYPDVAAGLDPLSHYLSNGAFERRDPGPKFSTWGYLSRYPDVAALGLNPLLHYLRVGRAEGREIAPAGTLRMDYHAWIRRYDAWTEADLVDLRRRGAELPRRPKVSILMCTDDAPEDLFREAINSVLAQTYADWELCIAGNCSTTPRAVEALRGFAKADPRIKVMSLPKKVGIANAMNAAFVLATGEWVTTLDDGDVLAPHALFHVAEAINEYPYVQLLYSDEDMIDETGSRHSPYFKPNFSPELFHSQNYLNSLTVYRADSLRAAGGWRAEFDGAHGYDLNLRVSEGAEAGAIHHIPRILYHRRAAAGLTVPSEKGHAYAAGLRALGEHVGRLGWAAQVEELTDLPYYRVRFDIPVPRPLVSIIIPTRDQADMLARCVESILKATTYEPFEILIVDNRSIEAKTFAYFVVATEDPRVRVVPYPQPFNYSAINNFAAQAAKGDVLAFVNNDVEVIAPDWLTEMVAWAAQEEIGCVGAKLYYPDDTIQHAGVIIGIGGAAGHSHRYFPRDHPGYFGRLKLPQTLSAVTGACLVVRKEVFFEVEGLDERFCIDFNDVDFCLKVRAAGYRNVWTPFAELYHRERTTRGYDDTPQKRERFWNEACFMKQKWGELLDWDPFYSRHLTQEREDFSIRCDRVDPSSASSFRRQD
jgi:GT2 family glycosyltransferase